jgi:allophanate hydrolase subunit 2
MHPGPDLSSLAEAARWLDVTPLRVAHASDRMGVRLVPPAGARLETRPAETSPMRVGAVQALASGELIVLGPDHPVTGGYPVVGVVDDDDLDTLFGLVPGASVRLRLVPDE